MLNNSLDQIDLCVNIEVCKVNLTLEKLLHLQVGDIVQTNVVPAAVKLVVNGQLIAEGFLVKLNDKSGVRITKIYQEEPLNQLE
jgi:flagellar motor switch protein FliN/FliY